MGFQNSYNNDRRPYNSRSQGYAAPRSGYSRPDLPAEIIAEPLPADYVDKAEQVIREHKQEQRSAITTNKIRNLYSLITGVYDTENLRQEDSICEKSKNDLLMMRIRMVYEAGRDPAVKAFVEKAKLLQYLKGIGTDRRAVLNLAHYMEALVAYHRFIIGGREG